jgi:predicted aldo/keto reductase-like oxidoreductase
MQKYDVLESADRALTDGRIGHLGFSFHDEFSVFKQVVDGYDRWAMCQIQYNYVNEDYQAGTRGLEYAASKGLAVVVMEPLLGGRLVNPPQAVQDLWATAGTQRAPVEWALDWLWSKPQVTVALSGMSKMEHVEQNVALAEQARVGMLSASELELVDRVRVKHDELCPIPCTQCRYCMPCPNGVDIPRNFATLNNGVMYNALEEARRRYERTDIAIRASACIQCQECEPKCPQDIPISEWMPVVDEALGEGRDLAACQLPG